MRRVAVEVSILVLVEVAQEEQLINGDARINNMFQSLFQWKWLRKAEILAAVPFGYYGFNPCSSGSGSGRPVRLYAPFAAIVVSILVLVEVAQEDQRGKPHYDHLLPFQSLFQWKWLRKDPHLTPSSSHTCSFNPCSSGSGSGRRLLYPASHPIYLFQSLFQWKWLRKKPTS